MTQLSQADMAAFQSTDWAGMFNGEPAQQVPLFLPGPSPTPFGYEPSQSPIPEEDEGDNGEEPPVDAVEVQPALELEELGEDYGLRGAKFRFSCRRYFLTYSQVSGFNT